MPNFNGLLDGCSGAWGVTFPGMPGCTAMGKTCDDVLRNASFALGEWLSHVEADVLPVQPLYENLRDTQEVREALAEGAIMVLVPAYDMPISRRVQVTIDSGVLAALDEAARRYDMSRSGIVNSIGAEFMRLNP